MRARSNLSLLALALSPVLAACSAILGAPDLPNFVADGGGDDSTMSDGSSSGTDSSSGGHDGTSGESGSSSGGQDSSSSSGSGSSSGGDASTHDGSSSSSGSGGDSSVQDAGIADSSSSSSSGGDGSDGNPCPVCTGGMICQGTSCVCPTGTHNCGGTCDSDTSNNSCGTMCSPCTGGTTCQTGTCQCPTGTHDCSGTCDSNTSDNSCGTMCSPCLGGTTCQNGSCQCPTGEHDCGGTCVSNTLTSSCGTLCTPCATPPSGHGAATCDGTSCGISCNTNYSLCSGDCVNEQIDPNHCNSCSNVCQYGVCQAATCKFTAIGAGYPNPGTGTTTIGANTLEGIMIGASSSTAVAIGLQTITGGVTMRLALYTDSGGKPGSLLAETGDLVSVAGGRTEGSIPGTATPAPGPYWVMTLIKAGTLQIATESNSVTYYYETGVTYGSFPPSFSGSSNVSVLRGDFYYITAP